MGDDDIAPEWGWQTLTTGANVSTWRECEAFAHRLTLSAGKHQAFSDQDDGLLGQKCCQILKGAVGSVLERTGESQWRSSPAPRG